MLGSIGLPELLFIMVLALLIFGPKRLPEIGKTLGKGLSEFRRATNDLKRTIDTEILAVDDDRRLPTAIPPAAPRRPLAAETAVPSEPTVPAASATPAPVDSSPATPVEVAVNETVPASEAVSPPETPQA